MKKAVVLLTILAAFLAVGFTSSPVQAGSIVGVVVDADDAGVAGAVVMVQGIQHRRGQRPFMARAESGEDGSFAFADVPDGRYVVTAMVRELGGARAEAAVVDGGEAAVRLVLQGRRGGGNGGGGEERPMGSLSGTVVDADGNAVGGAQVMLMPARLVNHRGQGRVGRIVAETDENGAFAVEELPAGQWVATARMRGVGAGRSRVEVVAEQNAEVEITLVGRR
jgi:hypothetical protein